jgi:hypothetical protein
MCDGDLLGEMAAVILVYHLCLLAYVALLCYRTWDMHDALSEHKSLTVSIVFALQTLLLSAPIIVLTRNNAVANTFAIASVVFLTNLCSIGMFVGPRVYLLKHGTVLTLETIRPGFAQPGPQLPEPSADSRAVRSKPQSHDGAGYAKVAPDTSSSVLVVASSGSGSTTTPVLPPSVGAGKQAANGEQAG